MDVKKIYLDMDGVLADFDRGVETLCHMPAIDQHKQTPAMSDMLFEAIKGVEHFYDRLDMLPGAKELFDTVYGAYGDRCEILTGIPKPWRGIVTAAADKESWMRRLLSKDIKMNIVIREDKKNYCHGPEYVLIDDFKANLKSWEQYGGTGILYRNAEDTIRQLKDWGIL